MMMILMKILVIHRIVLSKLNFIKNLIDFKKLTWELKWKKHL